jgi:hypothetical protein
VLRTAALCFLMGAGVARLGAQEYKWRAVAYLGNPVGNGDTFVNDFEPSLLNNAGAVAFTADTDQPGEEGCYLASPNGAITQLMRFGQPAPGGGTFSTFELGCMGLNNLGDACFAFTLAPLNFGPPVNGGVYRWSHLTHSLSAVVVPNVTPDPAGGVFVGAWFNTSLNDFGSVTFSGFVTNGTAGLNPPPAGQVGFNGFYGAFVQHANGQMETIARPGQASPAGGVFVEAGNSMLMNEFGQVVFTGQMTTDPTTDYFRLYSWDPFTKHIRLLPTPAGMVFPSTVVPNNLGQVAYGASFAPFPVLPGPGGIYLFSRGTNTLIAHTGSPAPGGGNFSYFPACSFQEQLFMNDWGDILFDAATSTGDEAMYLYSGTTKTLKRLVGVGTVIPGVGTIVSLEQGAPLTYPPQPLSGLPNAFAVINDLRQVAFAATVVSGTTTRGVLLLGTPDFCLSEEEQ